jgi:hypothetical protein
VKIEGLEYYFFATSKAGEEAGVAATAAFGFSADFTWTWIPSTKSLVGIHDHFCILTLSRSALPVACRSHAYGSEPGQEAKNFFLGSWRSTLVVATTRPT